MNCAFIGGGRMAQAIIRGLLEKPDDSIAIYVFDVSPAARTACADLVGPTNVFEECSGLSTVELDLIVIAVKPQDVQAGLESASALASGHDRVVISIAAGIELSILQKGLPSGVPVIRAMPNLPITYGVGVTALCAGPSVVAPQLDNARRVFEASGKVVVVDEALMDGVTAVSGSGPAYVFRFLSALARGGMSEGLSREEAFELAIQTCFGAARMLEAEVFEKNGEPADLIAAVASKGGTTEAALKVLDDRQFDDIIENAVKAAAFRSRELANLYKS